MIYILRKSNIIAIGIIEEGTYRSTFNSLKSLFLSQDYNISFENENKDMVIFENSDKEFLILDIDRDKIKTIESMSINFNIFIYNFTELKSNYKISLKKLLKNTDYLIINCDNYKWNLLIKNNIHSIIVTYGFNNKATATISSYNIDEHIEANICFQRKINSIYGEDIDPFEIPIKINSNRKNDIYCAIGALICFSIVEPSIALNDCLVLL